MFQLTVLHRDRYLKMIKSKPYGISSCWGLPYIYLKGYITLALLRMSRWWRSGAKKILKRGFTTGCGEVGVWMRFWRTHYCVEGGLDYWS